MQFYHQTVAGTYHLAWQDVLFLNIKAIFVIEFAIKLNIVPTSNFEIVTYTFEIYLSIPKICDRQNKRFYYLNETFEHGQNYAVNLYFLIKFLPNIL